MRTMCVGVLLTALLCFTSPTRAQEFKRYSPKGSNWSAAFPGEVKKIETRTPGGVPMTLCTVEMADGAYQICIGELNYDSHDLDADGIQIRLEVCRNANLKATGTKLISTRKIRLADKYAGIEVRAVLKGASDAYIRYRIFLVGDKVFQINVIGTEDFVDSDDATKFLDSFQLKTK